MATIINADTSNGLKLTSDTSGQLELQSAGSTKVTMDTSGKFGIGGTPSEPLSVFRTGGQTEGVNIRNTSSGNGSRLTFETTRSDDSSVQEMAAVQVYAVSGYDNASNSDAVLTFETQNSGTTAERMRINNNGQVTIGGTSWVGGSTDSGLQIDMNTSTDATFGLVVRNGSNAESLVHKMNGSTYNTTGTFGTLSDQRLKENIVDATSKLDEVKQLKVRNFNLIGEKEKQLGFVAQEIEKVFPNIVDTQAERTHEEIDDEGNVEIVTTPEKKLVKTTVLIPILTKALQEAITKIEDLETRIQTLENK